MTTQLSGAEIIIFDQSERFTLPEEHEREAAEIAKIVLDVSQITIDFASIERVPRYYTHRKENDAEHSFMLGLAAMAIGATRYPGLNTGLMTQFALVHDLVELKTNDVQTFKTDKKTLEAKHKAEQAALAELQKTLPPYLADMLTCYEEQVLPEARLVRHIDKLLPYGVDIRGAGLAVMEEDYEVTTAEQLLGQNADNEKRFAEMFPEQSHAILHRAHGVLATKFALMFDEV